MCKVISKLAYIIYSISSIGSTSIFTHRDPQEGKVGIGKVPKHIFPLLDEIGATILPPNSSATTFHIYYDDLAIIPKHRFNQIQQDPFWRLGVCDGDPENCIAYPVPEMNEVYYSNPKPGFERGNLYGAAANLIPHRDCILYRFYGIQFYRVIIGLTDGNTDTATHFVNLGIEHKINRGDFIVFDFDKTVHRVRKDGFTETPRILLKIHYIVCENCAFSKEYVVFVSLFYKWYYLVARYTEQLGTDPETFMGFFFGIMWEYPFYSSVKYSVFFLFATTWWILYRRCPRGRPGLQTTALSIAAYLTIVSGFWLRYQLFGIR